MASPSAVSWISHSIAKFSAIAALAAPGMFSMMPRVWSCRPRWATGRDASPQLALGDQLALRIDADLPRNEQQVSSADKADIIGHRGGRFMQRDALCRQFLLDRARHVSSPG